MHNPLASDAAARILDLGLPPPSRPRSPLRTRLVLAFAAISTLAAHEGVSSGFPRMAPVAVESPAGAANHATKSDTTTMTRSITLATALGLLVTTQPTLAQDAVQWRVEDGGNGHWYLLIDDGVARTWHAANELSAAVSGYLATLATEQEDGFVRSYCAQNADGILGPWLGGYQDVNSSGYLEPAGGWRWVTDEKWNWALWDRPGDSEPNNAQCGPENFLHLALDVPEGRWNDIGANGCFQSGLHGLIVEFDADCNTDGLVDFGQILAGELADANGNNIPDCCEGGPSCAPCPGDADASGTVDGVDLAIILSRWGTPAKDYPAADTNGDGTVDGIDLATVLGGWGACP